VPLTFIELENSSWITRENTEQKTN